MCWRRLSLAIISPTQHRFLVTMMHNPQIMRCAVYARYSSDSQRESSVEDQIRKCREFAASSGGETLEGHVYCQHALSGTGSDRPALQRLLALALGNIPPFDTILVDDTSRLSRSLAEVMRIQDLLRYKGIRLIAVSQGIDSNNEQSDVMFTVHGLVDALYVKELAKKTHRGLEELALKGQHTGGSCFGYRSVHQDGVVRLQIDEGEAIVLRRIFTLYADGHSYKSIAKLLNGEKVPPPRTARDKSLTSWCFTAIREMLRRELYRGCIVWNQRKYLKTPGTNRRVSRRRPVAEWIVRDAPHLRIVTEELWTAVEQQRELKKRLHPGVTGKCGLLRRSASVPLLFSGLLKCGACGANLTIVGGRGTRKGRIREYGCPHFHHRGTCKNDLRVRLELVEQVLLGELQTEILRPRAIEYLLDQVMRKLNAAPGERMQKRRELCSRQLEMNREHARKGDGIAKADSAKYLLKILAEKEVECMHSNSRSSPSLSTQWSRWL